MEIDLLEKMNQIRLYENLKECYMVKLYYLGSKSCGLNENEANELKIQKLLLSKQIETITFKLAQLYVDYDNFYQALIDYKTNISMLNGNTTFGRN
jgi:hypothetical protein